MSSFISFIRNMFSSNTETPKSDLILTKDGWVVLKPSPAEVTKIEREIYDVQNPICNGLDIMNPLHPLHPLNIKCGSSFGMQMMCLTN